VTVQSKQRLLCDNWNGCSHPASSFSGCIVNINSPSWFKNLLTSNPRLPIPTMNDYGKSSASLLTDIATCSLHTILSLTGKTLLAWSTARILSRAAKEFHLFRHAPPSFKKSGISRLMCLDVRLFSKIAGLNRGVWVDRPQKCGDRHLSPGSHKGEASVFVPW
jgi:hypothetical protein